MTRKDRGEGSVGLIIVVALLALACVMAAAGLGREIVSLIVGTKDTNAAIEGRMNVPAAQAGDEEEDEDE